MRLIEFALLFMCGRYLAEQNLHGSLDTGGVSLEPERYSAVLRDSSGRVVSSAQLFHSGVFLLPLTGTGRFRLSLEGGEGVRFKPEFYEVESGPRGVEASLPGFTFRLFGVRFEAKVFLNSGGISVPFPEPTMVCLSEQGGRRIEVLTNAFGIAVFEDLSPGSHHFSLCGLTKHKVTSSEVVCDITHKSEKCVGGLALGDFTLLGEIEGLPEDTSGLKLFFETPQGKIECSFLHSKAEFQCENMVFGKFLASVSGGGQDFSVLPESVEVKSTQRLRLSVFQVFSLSIEAPEGSNIFFNGGEAGPAPLFRKGLRAQTLRITAKHPNYEFSDGEVVLMPGSASKHTLKFSPIKVLLCGKVNGVDRADVRAFRKGTDEVLATSTTNNGNFCLHLPPGEVWIEVSDSQKQKIFPERQRILLTDRPISPLEFSPIRHNLHVTARLRSGEDPSLHAKTELRVFDLTGRVLNGGPTNFDAEGRAVISGLEEPRVRLEVRNEALCFETESIEVDTKIEKVEFVHTGYRLNLEVDLPLRVKLTSGPTAGRPWIVNPENKYVCVPEPEGVIIPHKCYLTQPANIPFKLPFQQSYPLSVKKVFVRGSVFTKGDAAFTKRVAQTLFVFGIVPEDFKTGIEGSKVNFEFKFPPMAPITGTLGIRDKDQKWFIFENAKLKESVADCSDGTTNAVIRPAMFIKGVFPFALDNFRVEGPGLNIQTSGKSFETGVFENPNAVKPVVKSQGFVISERYRVTEQGFVSIYYDVRRVTVGRITFLDSQGNLFTKEKIKVSILQKPSEDEHPKIFETESGELLFELEAGEYYLAPLIKEHIASPAQTYFSTNGDKDEHIEFIVDRVAYSFHGTVGSRPGELPLALEVEAVPVDSTLSTETALVRETGEFSLKNLKPGQSYIITMKPQSGYSLNPSSKVITVGEEDQAGQFMLVRKSVEEVIKTSIDSSKLEDKIQKKLVPFKMIVKKKQGDEYVVLEELHANSLQQFNFAEAVSKNTKIQDLQREVCSGEKVIVPIQQYPKKVQKKEKKAEQKKSSLSIFSLIFMASLLVSAGIFSFLRLR